MRRTEKGITLIALIITIIVMLILVGVTVTSALNGGLFNTARDATKSTRNEIKEEAKLAEGFVKIGEKEISLEEYSQNLETIGQNTETNKDIGIGTDGKLVNLDLWQYTYVDGKISQGIEIKGYVLNKMKLNTSTNLYEVDNTIYDYAGYLGEIINGEIEGKVPKYIKPEGGNEFIEVVSMCSTFFRNTLQTAPQIPDTVIDMNGAFSQCQNLTTVPKIPNSVTDIGFTFNSCKNLSTAPTIPNSVTNMSFAFVECTNLTGEITINANPTNYIACFWNTSIAENANLVIKGSCTQETKNNLRNTKAPNSHITIGE